ncbi:DMT family transporter [Asaccharospora irregularis]|uniref:XK-related protein n=1 Tax=Asaccharospora irregularis DSM 2635 TaxID=1121321 RepID=A0A1M5MFT6_9FIRM|nr:DMT family transporter [Asaccharospora irregularis]SHG76042.1 XK-related protein [Asaccharospora irregularis DSM 2635]
MDSKKKGIGLVVIATTFWGMMGITSRKLSLSGLSTFDVSFLRCLIAGLLFTFWILRKDKNLLKLDIKGIIICSLYGIVAFASSFISYNISVERIPISIATVLMFTNPIWVTVFGETLNLIQILGAIIVILAAVILEIDIKVFINNIKLNLNLKKEESQ